MGGGGDSAYLLSWFFSILLVPSGASLLSFTCLPTSFFLLGPSGGTIFLLVKKDSGERHAKGLQSRPLETCFDTGERRGDVLTSYEFALVQLTQLSRLRRSAYPLASACCGAKVTVLPYDFLRSLRTSAHTGVAIRTPFVGTQSTKVVPGARIATSPCYGSSQ